MVTLNTYAAHKNAAQTFGALQTFSAGIDVVSGSTLKVSGLTSGYTALVAPTTGSNVTYTLPGADGTNNQVLTTNGLGTLSWLSVSGAAITLASTNAWTGVNSFAAKTTTSRLMGSTVSGYPFDTLNNGTITLSDAIAAQNLAKIYDPGVNGWTGNDNFAFINTYGSKWTGMGFHAGTGFEVLRVASSLSMTGYTKWQNVNAVVIGYLNDGPRILIQDYDLATEQTNTVRVLADNIVFGITGSGGLSYQSIRTIADVSTTLDHTAAYILLGGTGAYTITLPSASTSNNTTRGRWYCFKKITATNVVTITAASGETIDGAASTTISTQYAALRIIAATDTAWYTV
jgi:hypothetical protein